MLCYPSAGTPFHAPNPGYSWVKTQCCHNKGKFTDVNVHFLHLGEFFFQTLEDKHHVNGKWVDVKRGKLMISETLLVDVGHGYMTIMTHDPSGFHASRCYIGWIALMLR